ncbi:MAG TPA: HAMP domain-containing sensor histidine kinase [Candidatus Solibacter sp.]|nr:HAMP domain-containing sensor histidine kinase [Candidatus Solibacter sp.]
MIWFLLLQGILAVCGLFGGVLYARRQQLKAFDAELGGRMSTLLAKVENQDGKLELSQQELIPAGHIYFLRTSVGRVIALKGSPRLLSDSAMHRPGAFIYEGKPYRGTLWRSVVLPEEELDKHGNPATVDLLYAMPAAEVDSRFLQLVIAAAAVTFGFLILSALATWWAIVKGLAPLNDLAERAGAMDAENWRFEVPAQAVATTELAPLGNALTQLITRLKAAFDRERRFVSDAGHELKTAVAIQKSTLQLLERGEPSVSGYKQGIARALEDTMRAEKLVTSMLRLASSESGGTLQSVSVLEDSLTAAIADLDTVAEKLNVRIAVSGAYLKEHVTGDTDELSVVWRNVLENALQHSPAGAEVSVDVQNAPGNALEIRITDAGPGVAAEDLPHVFERFYRADHSRARTTGGFGLGLAIAKSLVERNRGSIEMQSAIGRGACVVIRLATPAAKISRNGGLH